MQESSAPFQFVGPEKLSASLAGLSKNLSTSHIFFTHKTACSPADMEWNSMDQHHRPCVHKLYEQVSRLALSPSFGVSLTRMGRLPFFVTVTDVRLGPGLYYHMFTLLGIFTCIR